MSERDFFGDIMHEEKGHEVLLGLRYRKFKAFIETVDEMYRGENA